jgi:hypothetical protein
MNFFWLIGTPNDKLGMSFGSRPSRKAQLLGRSCFGQPHFTFDSWRRAELNWSTVGAKVSTKHSAMSANSWAVNIASGPWL